MEFMEIIAVSAMSHKQQVDTRCGQNAGVSNVTFTAGGAHTTTVLYEPSKLLIYIGIGNCLWARPCSPLETQTLRHLEKGKVCLIYGVQILGKKSVKQFEK